ncbi:MAG TPA: hypothetical protein PKI44_07330, partial [Candidatus Omnitrophota bacterium]|nr:hypothetical protein [Candidatus Omnitrophota bacterium]
ESLVNLTNKGTVEDKALEGVSLDKVTKQIRAPPEALSAMLLNLAGQLEERLSRSSGKDAAKLQNAIAVLKSTASALGTLTEDQKSALDQFNRIIRMVLMDKAVRRDEEDVLSALLKKLMSVIKTRNLRNLNGRYFRAARLIAHRYGLSYSSMVQLEAAFILLNETEDFINALKDEDFVRAELAARTAVNNVETVESTDGQTAKVENKASAYDILNNILSILNNSAAGYVSGINNIINAIKIGLAAAQASLSSIIEALTRGMFGAFNTFLSNLLGAFSQLPGSPFAKPFKTPEAVPVGQEINLDVNLSKLATRDLVTSLIALERILENESRARIIKSESLVKFVQVVIEKLSDLPPPVIALIRFAVKVINLLTKGGKNVKHNQNPGAKRINGRNRHAVPVETFRGVSASGLNGKPEFEVYLDTEAEQLINRPYIELNNQAKLGVHLLRAPPVLVASASILAAVIIYNAVIISQITLTLPLIAISILGIVVAAIIIGGVLCALKSKISEWTTSLTTPRTTQLSQPRVTTVTTISRSSWLTIQATFISAMAGLAAGWQSLAQQLIKSGSALIKLAGTFRFTKLTPFTLTKSALTAAIIALFVAVKPALASTGAAAENAPASADLVLPVMIGAGLILITVVVSRLFRTNRKASSLPARVIIPARQMKWFPLCTPATDLGMRDVKVSQIKYFSSDHLSGYRISQIMGNFENATRKYPSPVRLLRLPTGEYVVFGDGNHRVMSAKLLGKRTIYAHVFSLTSARRLPRDASSKGTSRKQVSKKIAGFGGIKAIIEKFGALTAKSVRKLYGVSDADMKKLFKLGVKFIRGPPELGVVNHAADSILYIIIPENATAQEVA